MRTQSRAYAQRLVALERTWWRRALPVQAPYRWNLRRQRLGRTLDVGCGVGRNLAYLDSGSIGVDHNEASVAVARARGLDAMTVSELFSSDDVTEGSFDAILVAHVLEHMPREAALDLLGRYLPYLRSGGRVFLVCPQERGYASDPTHESFLTGAEMVALARAAGLRAERWRSFPLPRAAGKVFTYNEFNVMATKP